MTRQTESQPTTIKILGKEYRIRTDGDPNHIEYTTSEVESRRVVRPVREAPKVYHLTLGEAD